MPHSIHDTVAIVFDFGVLVKFFIKFADVKYVFFLSTEKLFKSMLTLWGRACLLS